MREIREWWVSTRMGWVGGAREEIAFGDLVTFKHPDCSKKSSQNLGSEITLVESYLRACIF